MDIDTWASHLRTDSTRKAYTYALRQFFLYWHVTPEQSLTWTVEQVEERLLEWKQSLVDRGLAGQSVHIFFAAVKRWFVDNHIRIVVKCEDISVEKTYLDYIPTREDVRLLLDDCPLRLRLAVALLAFSGMRPVDICELQYKHVRKSLESTDDVVTIIKQQRKTHQWYFTFLAPQGVRYLRSVLEMRQKAGEIIQDDTYLLTKMHQPMKARQLKRAVAWVIQRRFTRHPTNESFRVFRPYGLRKYFRRTIARLGEDVAEFLMGHSGGISSLTATYSGLRDMDETAIQALKEQYRSILPELETELSEQTIMARMAELEAQKADFEAMKAEMKRISETLERFKRKKKQGASQ